MFLSPFFKKNNDLKLLLSVYCITFDDFIPVVILLPYLELMEQLLRLIILAKRYQILLAFKILHHYHVHYQIHGQPLEVGVALLLQILIIRFMLS